MDAGLASESARTFPEASMMVARAPAARPSCAAISERGARSISTRWAKRRVFCVRLRSISVRSEASHALPIMTSRVAAVAAMTMRKTARSLKKMRFFTFSSFGEAGTEERAGNVNADQNPQPVAEDATRMGHPPGGGEVVTVASFGGLEAVSGAAHGFQVTRVFGVGLDFFADAADIN